MRATAVRAAAGGAIVALALAASAPGRARELWRRGEASLAFTGSLREILIDTNGTDRDDFATDLALDPGCAQPATFADCAAFDRLGDRDVVQSTTRLRLRLDGRVGRELSAAVAYDHEWRVGDLDTLGDVLAGPPRETFLGAEDDIQGWGFSPDDAHRRWSHRLYRAWVRWEPGPLVMTVGRQRIPWGVGRLWNPIDRFNPIGPLAIEPDESPGVDAVDLRWQLSGFRYLQVVYAPGTRSEDARVALRGQGTFGGVDLSAMAGIFEQARALGVDATGNLGGAAWRVEAVWTDPERDVWPLDAAAPFEPDPYAQVVAGLDGNLDVGTGIYWLVEHLYNGAALGFGEGEAGTLLPFFEQDDDPAAALVPTPGAPGPFVRPASDAVFQGSGVVTSSEHTTGFQVGYDLSLAWRADLLLLWDWDGSSAAFFPTVQYTGWNAGNLTLGAQLFAGGERSQFGEQEALFYVLFEVFF